MADERPDTKFRVVDANGVTTAGDDLYGDWLERRADAAGGKVLDANGVQVYPKGD